MAKGTKTTELREKSDADLAAFIQTSTKELLEARFQNYAGQLNDTSKVAGLRRDIARAHTVRAQRQKAGK